MALPVKQHGFQPIAFDTIDGKATGDAYTWTMKEGTFTVTYADFGRVLDEPSNIKANLDGVAAV